MTTSMIRTDADFIDRAKWAAGWMVAAGTGDGRGATRDAARAVHEVLAGLERAEDEVGRLEQAARTIYLHDGRTVLLGSEAEAVEYRKTFAKKYRESLSLLTEIAGRLGVRFRNMDDPREILDVVARLVRERDGAVSALGEVEEALGIDGGPAIDIDEILAAIEARPKAAPAEDLVGRFAQSFGKIAEALGLDVEAGVHIDDILNEIATIEAESEDGAMAEENLDELTRRLASLFGEDYAKLFPIRWRSMLAIVEARVAEMRRDLYVANAAREALETKLRKTMDERDLAMRAMISRDREDGWKITDPDYYRRDQAQRLYAVREHLRAESRPAPEPPEEAPQAPEAAEGETRVRVRAINVYSNERHAGVAFEAADEPGKFYVLAGTKSAVPPVAEGDVGTLVMRPDAPPEDAIRFVPDAARKAG